MKIHGIKVMSKNKNRWLLDKTILCVKLLMYALLVFTVFIFIYYGLINKGDVIEDEPVWFLEDWDFSEPGDGNQIISSTLPQGIKDNEYLFFDARKDVSVYVGDELRKDFIEKRDVNLPGGSFKRFLMTVPLKAEDAGQKITIVRKSPAEYDKELSEVFIGTRSGGRSYLFRTLGIPFVMAFIVLIFSFVAFVVSVVLRFWYKQNIDMLYGALGIFSIAAWLITDSHLFPFVFGVDHVNSLLSFLFCLTMPLPLLLYLSSVQRYRYKRLTPVVALVAILNALVWPFLHFTGIVPFDKIMDPANVVLVILAASGMLILMIDAAKGNAGTYRYTFIGFFGFLVCGLMELIFILLNVTIFMDSFFIVMGLGFLLTFIVIQQVYELRMLNQEKQHAIDVSEAKTQFLASMSHEIRTPINAILGMNEMILRENKDKTIEEYSQNVKTSGKMLLMLVNDVLDFTKIEAGKLEITNAPFFMSDVLFDVISLIRERAEEKNLLLSSEITGQVPDAMISDEFRIRQILINLMNNAVKYTQKGSVTLTIGGEYTEDGFLLSLRVKDTGKGIPKEDQAHLFEAFSRADLKSNRNIEGTGLGLAIVKSIVDSMNGQLGVESEYGAGSEFWVKLPVKYENKNPLREDFMEQRTRQAEASERCSFTAPKAKILVVDDNASNLTIVKLFLKRNEIVPDLCSSGLQAVKMCKEKRYDLILLDHMMPQPDGIETLHLIREDEASMNRDTKVIVLTANAVAGSRQMYMAEGFDDYLTKPLDSGVLEETVKRMLPQQKVVEPVSTHVKEAEAAGHEGIFEFEAVPAGDSVKETVIPAKAEKEDQQEVIKNRLCAIEDFDHETALRHCAGDASFLSEIISDVANEGLERIERMKNCLEEKDMKSYQIEAHAAKSSMATIGLKSFSERAKKHEFAARDKDTDFIFADADDFLKHYEQLCGKLKEACG